MPNLEQYSDDCASHKDEQEYVYVYAESEQEIVDETIRPSPTKMRTRSKSRKPVLPEPIICSDTEDDESCLRQRKRTHAIATPLRAGGTSNFFAKTRIIFQVLQARNLRLERLEQARKEASDQVQDSASEEADSNLTTTLNFSLSSH